MNELPSSPTPFLLIVYLHGFKGDDTTFRKFPERLNHILQESFNEVTVKSVVFPQWETRGVLAAAVERFSDWLATITVEKEKSYGGAGKANIVLCGHSMGGILAADAIRNIASSRADVKALLWPRVIGLIAFDTPYLGLHPNVFKHTFTKAATNIQAAKELASSIGLLAPAFMTGANAVFPSWSTKSPPTETTEPPTGLRDANPSGRPGSTRTPSDRPDGIVSDQPKASSGGWASKWTKGTPLVYGIGAAAVAAGAAGAYYKREHLGLGMGWAQDHLQFVGNLWDGEAMRARLDDLDQLVREEGLVFRNFYTQLAPDPASLLPRTFCILPSSQGATRPFWVSAKNNIVKGEIDAHTEMFSPGGNDNYYDLGLRAADSIGIALTYSRNSQSAVSKEKTEP